MQEKLVDVLFEGGEGKERFLVGGEHPGSFPLTVLLPGRTGARVCGADGVCAEHWRFASFHGVHDRHGFWRDLCGDGGVQRMLSLRVEGPMDCQTLPFHSSHQQQSTFHTPPHRQENQLLGRTINSCLLFLGPFPDELWGETPLALHQAKASQAHVLSRRWFGKASSLVHPGKRSLRVAGVSTASSRNPHESTLSHLQTIKHTSLGIIVIHSALTAPSPSNCELSLPSQLQLRCGDLSASVYYLSYLTLAWGTLLDFC